MGGHSLSPFNTGEIVAQCIARDCETHEPCVSADT